MERRRDPLAGFPGGRRQGRQPLVRLAVRVGRLRGVHPGQGPRPRRTGEPLWREGARHRGGGPLFGVQGDEARQGGTTAAGLLLGAPEKRFPRRGKELAETERLGGWLAGTNRRVVQAQRRTLAGESKKPSVQAERQEPAAGGQGDAAEHGSATARGEPAPGQEAGVAEHAGALGGTDAVRGQSTSADGQQRQREDIAGSGVVPQELLRQRL